MALTVASSLSTSGGSSAAAASTSTTASTNVIERPLTTEVDSRGVHRLALQPDGWNTWKWKGHKVNWLSAGDKGPVVLLIHGFGASVYHWRYLIPELSKHCRVYAIDCLGFGWSEKPLIEYNGYTVWKDQILDFLRDVVGAGSNGNQAVLVGNSLGGYNALAAAAGDSSLVKGVVLLNAAGRFDENPYDVVDDEDVPVATPAQQDLWSGLIISATTAAKRLVISLSFIYTKQPARIRQVLGQVYVDKTNIDDDLVKSIEIPAQDPNAPEVFYRVITANGTPVNRLLKRMKDMPVYLLWGEKDPWCVPARATQIQNYYPKADRTDILSGHCPHDDTPQLVSGPLLQWIEKLA